MSAPKMRRCQAEKCCRKHYALGFCTSHYDQWSRVKANAARPAPIPRREFSEAQLRMFKIRGAKAAFWSHFLTAALKETGGNVTDAARLCQHNRTHFYALLKRYGITIASEQRRRGGVVSKMLAHRREVRDNKWAQFAIALTGAA